MPKKPAYVLAKPAGPFDFTKINTKRPGLKIAANPSKTYTQIPRPYFHKWVEQCGKIPADHWQAAKKNKTTQSKPIPISEMHTMQLVNAIKWCMRLASQTLVSKPYVYINATLLTLLNEIPQWPYLLLEAKNRQLKIIGHEQIDWITGDVVGIDYYKWFEEAWQSAVEHGLDK